jgi:hypothetical protein
VEIPLRPGEWIDDLPEPLHAVADVEEVFAMVDRLMAARIVEKIRTRTYFPSWPIDRT